MSDRLSAAPAALLVGVYAVFTLAAGARAGVQIATVFSEAPLAYLLSALAAVVYLVATVALLRSPGGSALAAVCFELAGVLAVGTRRWPTARPSPTPRCGRATAAGYGFVPLVLPVLGLLWLRRGARLRSDHDPSAENAGADLRAYVDASPVPSTPSPRPCGGSRRPGSPGCDEAERWTLAPGDARWVVRDGGSLIAFRVGSAPLPEAGVRLVGTHTDSPTFKVRPRHDLRRGGYRLLGVEPYGGLLAHTWLDRELTVAGRLALADGSLPRVVLPGGQVRLPSLAIHLDRGVREGLVLDPQQHLVPVWGAGRRRAPLLAALAEVAGVDAADVVGHDLVLADTQPAAATGGDGTWVAAPRLDNLHSCHSAAARAAGRGGRPAHPAAGRQRPRGGRQRLDGGRPRLASWRTCWPGWSPPPAAPTRRTCR